MYHLSLCSDSSKSFETFYTSFIKIISIPIKIKDNKYNKKLTVKNILLNLSIILKLKNIMHIDNINIIIKGINWCLYKYQDFLIIKGEKMNNEIKTPKFLIGHINLSNMWLLAIIKYNSSIK